MLHFAASDLVIHCLPMSHKKDAKLIWVKVSKRGQLKCDVHFDAFGMNAD